MWKYERKVIKFELVRELLDKLNELGADGWEVINYEEKKPSKFGDNYETIVLLKKKKSWLKEKMLLFMKTNSPR